MLLLIIALFLWSMPVSLFFLIWKTAFIAPIPFVSVHSIHQTCYKSTTFVDNWNDNCEAKSEEKSPRPLRGLQVDFSLTRNVFTRSDNNIICKRTV